MSTRISGRYLLAAGVLTVVAVLSGCGGSGNGYDSPILNEDVPVADIADLPDIEQTRTQMLDLLERVRAEVARLVPSSEPWRWAYDESRAGCTQKETGRKGISLYFAKLYSDVSLTGAQWDLVFPAVQRLAADAGLTDNNAMANDANHHDVRFSSDDGRTLVFASAEASLITARIACRRAVNSTTAASTVLSSPRPGRP